MTRMKPFSMLLISMSILALSIGQVRCEEESCPLTDRPVPSITELCSYKDVKLTRRSQLVTLLTHLKDAQVIGKCPLEVLTTLVHSNELVAVSDRDVCTMDMAQAMKKYYEDFLAKKGKFSKKSPRSLKRFMVAFGMQMSNTCRANMLQVVTEGGRDLLKAEDLAKLGRWASDEGPLRRLLDRMNLAGEFFLPSDVAALIERKKSTEIDTMYIQSEATESIRHLKETCEKRFQPIYEQLIMPLTVLTSVGFNYMSDELLAKFKDPEKAAVVARWTNIVFLCEALKLVEPVDFVEGEEESKAVQKIKNDNKPGQLLRLLTKEEADEVNEKLKSRHQQQEVPRDDADVKQVAEKFEAVTYETNKGARIGDLVLDESNAKLKKKIKKFKSNKTSMDRMKGRMIRSGLLTVRSMLKKKELKIVATAAAKAAWDRLKRRKSDKKEGEVNKVLIQTVEKMADKSIEAEFKATKSQAVLFVVVLVCGLAALAATAWAVAAAVIGVSSALAFLIGFGAFG